MADLHGQLAYCFDRFWEKNDRQVRRLLNSFEVAAGALVVELLAFVVLFARTLS